jgi:hypothetical protein
MSSTDAKPAWSSRTIACSQHRGGWDHYLDRLTVRAAGGDPGPDTTAAG